MARFLFTTLPSDDLGLLTRTLPIATALAARGHEIVYCSPAQAPSRLIAEAGFANLVPAHPACYLQLSGELDLRRLFRQLTSREIRRVFGGPVRFLGRLVRDGPPAASFQSADAWNMDHFWAGLGFEKERFLRSTSDAMVDLIARCDPDVVVDSWNLCACLAATILRKPLAAVIQADGHPNSRGFIWWREPAGPIPSPVPLVNALLAEHGIAPIATTTELTSGNLTLVLGTPDTDPLPPGTRVTYVGPILWQSPHATLPDWIDGWRAGWPLVWVYTGNPQYLPTRTAADSGVVLDSCIEALAGEDVRVVLTTGHQPLPKRARVLPANFRHCPYVPGISMAERCDLMIHHGGYGSCQTGLFAGTPAVIIPTYSERESNARRVAALGAGAVIVPDADRSGVDKRVSAAALREKVREVLRDPSYRANARRISSRIRGYGGASCAADAIEAFAASRQPRESDAGAQARRSPGLCGLGVDR